MQLRSILNESILGCNNFIHDWRLYFPTRLLYDSDPDFLKRKANITIITMRSKNFPLTRKEKQGMRRKEK
jgi:hypothetical protein